MAIEKIDLETAQRLVDRVQAISADAGASLDQLRTALNVAVDLTSSLLDVLKAQEQLLQEVDLDGT